MNKGDKYKHYKGDNYIFNGIALPLKEYAGCLDTIHYNEWVRHHEDKYDLVLYSCENGIQVIYAKVPHVIYQSQKDDKLWAIELDSFFGFTETEKGVEKQFSLVVDTDAN